jgi:hypothetical protein
LQFFSSAAALSNGKQKEHPKEGTRNEKKKEEKKCPAGRTIRLQSDFTIE